MLTKDQFFAKYSLSDEYLGKAGINWETLGNIYATHSDKFMNKWWDADILEPVLHFFEPLTGAGIHFTRARIKDPERVVLKIIKHAQEMCATGAPVVISSDNYTDYVKDIIGIRLIYLFSSDWIKIHEKIVQKYGKKIQGGPIAYVGLDDPKDFKDFFESHGCKVESNSSDARFVEYNLHLSDSAGSVYPVEIQARTIFEEAATEVSTALQYPKRDYSVLVDNNLTLLRNLASQANKVATYTSYLKNKLDADYVNVQNLRDSLELFQVNRAEAELGKFQIITKLEDIRKLISIAKTDLAIEKLYIYIRENPDTLDKADLGNALDLISNKNNHRKDQLNKGLISFEESERTFNQISVSLLDFIQQLNAGIG